MIFESGFLFLCQAVLADDFMNDVRVAEYDVVQIRLEIFCSLETGERRY